MPRDYILKDQHEAQRPISSFGESSRFAHGSGFRHKTQAPSSSGSKRNVPALSIKPPWSWLITHSPVGKQKDYENRTWKTAFRGPFLVHSSMKPIINWLEVCDHVRAYRQIEVPHNAPCGVILGISTMIDCVDATTQNLDDESNFWLMGPWGFKLKDSRPFSKPIPYKGALGFFTVPLEPVIIEQIKEHKEYHGLIQ